MDLKIVIIGAGEVGYNLAHTLAKEDYDITVIDINPEKCKRISNSIDARVIEGDGASQRILQDVGMDDIDFLLCLTRIDEVNLVASRIGKKMGAKRVICRLRNTEYRHRNAVITPEQFGIDMVTYPEKAAQEEIEMLIRQPSSVEIQEFYNNRLKMIGIQLESSSPLIGRTVQNVEISNPFIHHKLVTVIRDEHSFIPHQYTKYKSEDIVFFVGKENEISDIQQMAGKPGIPIENIIIFGAGKIGRLLAKSLQNDYNVRLVDHDGEKAKPISTKLSETLMLVGSATDLEFLEGENVGKMDVAIAVTENEQTNIMNGLICKHLGVKQVIIHITTTSHLHAVRRLGVDAIVSKNISAVNEVIRFIRSGQSVFVKRFEDIDVESIQLTVSPTCKFLRRKYTIEKISGEIAIGAVLKADGGIEIPNRFTVIHSQDELLMFAKPALIEKAQELFI